MSQSPQRHRVTEEEMMNDECRMTNEMMNDECRMMNDRLSEKCPDNPHRRMSLFRHLSFSIHHSSFRIHHSSFRIHHSSFRIHHSSARRAFTLIEILVVVTILAMLASAIVLSFSGETDRARVARAKSDIATLENAIDRFKLDMRRYPAEEEGLVALAQKPDSEDATRWKGPYIKRLEKDPWGNPYVYVVPGDHNTESYDLICYGADGQEGGPGEYDKDIGNWAQEERPE